MAGTPKGEPRYQVPRELADSLAFRTLPTAAKMLWHDMMMKYRGYNNGNINAALTELSRYGWRSSATLAKALAYLIAHGLIRETRMGGKRAGDLSQCCLYAFTHLPTNSNPELGIRGKESTFGYRNFDPSKSPMEGKISLQKIKRDALNCEASRFSN